MKNEKIRYSNVIIIYYYFSTFVHSKKNYHDYFDNNFESLDRTAALRTQASKGNDRTKIIILCSSM